MNYKLNKGAQQLTKLLGIEIPIIQAPAGGTVTSDLVAEVSNTGAFGGIPLSWSSPEVATAMIKEVRSKTDKPFYANFVLNFEPVALQTALDLGVKTIQFSWGMPTPEMIDLIRAANGVMGIQVTNLEASRTAIALGADYLVCQGIEAGGHVQSSRPLLTILENILKLADGIPVVASGGIADAKAMHRYMAMGAAGVVMGSRFVATKESGAHLKYKNALVKAKAEDTIFTVCMNKGWDSAAHRILRNKTTELWEAAGCPVIGERPGEFDIVARRANNDPIERYDSDSPLQGMTGDVETMANYAGHSVNNIHDIPSVQELIDSIWNEFKIL
ncbi:nitronate monooxygenase [Flavobacteriaceae bacterium AU392]|nr:nitronate monooxygenase [Flavobacteriaceae bacterium]RKM85834.1 nitronate monooxygenase [Flavobacteriaceae bacterium AU392]